MDANNLTVAVQINENETTALLDTGATISTISASYWRTKLQQKSPTYDSTDLTKVKTVSGDPFHVLGKLNIPCVSESNNFTLSAYITEGITFDIILGRDFLQKHKARIDLREHKIGFQPDSLENFPFPDYSALISDDNEN